MNLFIPPQTQTGKSPYTKTKQTYTTHREKKVFPPRVPWFEQWPQNVFLHTIYALSRDSGHCSVFVLSPPNMIPHSLNVLGDCSVSRTELSLQVDEGRTDFHILKKNVCV